MCGRMRLRTGNVVKRGDVIRMHIGNNIAGPVIEGPWNGLLRIEKKNTYWKGHVELGLIEAKSYFENDGNKEEWEFILPPGCSILAARVLDDTYPNQPGDIVVVTREAQTEDEIQVHDRHPFVVRLK